MLEPKDVGEGEGEKQPPQKIVNKFFSKEEIIAPDIKETPAYRSLKQLEQTLAIIKPDAMDRAEEILSVIHREGFAVLQARRVKLSADQAASFFQETYNADWSQGNVDNLSSGPLLALVLSGPGAVNHWYQLVGPTLWGVGRA